MLQLCVMFLYMFAGYILFRTESITIKGSRDIAAISVFIALSTPAGANVAVYSQLYDADYPYACQVVAMTALLSIVTFPLMILAASHFGV